MYNYIHIGTHPSQIVATDSKLAKLTIDTLTEKAKEHPNHLITIPTSLANMGGVDLTQTGEPYALPWKLEKEDQQPQDEI